MNEDLHKIEVARIVQLAGQLSDELEKAFMDHPGGLRGAMAAVSQALEDVGGFKEFERLAALQREIEEAREQQRRVLEATPPPSDLSRLRGLGDPGPGAID